MSKENATQHLKKNLPKSFKKRRYYIKSQLEHHNNANDIWLCFFDDIYDLTELVQQNRQSALVEPLINAAGTDITHWFDDKTKQPRKHINNKGQEQLYLPGGLYIHADQAKDPMFIPWWKNQEKFIGKRTRKSQLIRIINTLSNTEDQLEVPREETIWQILNRYEEINFHARSYTWKRNEKVLNMDQTLTENGIVDQSDLYQDLEVPPEFHYVPAIHIHFNDDLTTK